MLALGLLSTLQMLSCRDPEEFDEVFHINVAGVYATIQAFYPLLKVRAVPRSRRLRSRRRHFTLP